MTATAGLVLSTIAACKEPGSSSLSPTASALVADAPKSTGATSLVVEAAESQVRFVMDAPFEKIHGELPKSLTGEISVDPSDLRKTTGLVAVDLETLELFRQARDDEKSGYGEREKSDKQNEHARDWLEISDDAPAAERKKNARVEFKLTKLETASPDLTKLSGRERKVEGTLTGTLQLRGREIERKVPFSATFVFEGDALSSLTVETTQPMDVDLESFDVRPRSAFGKLAQKTLGEMAGKVSKAAPVNVTLVAKVKPK